MVRPDDPFALCSFVMRAPTDRPLLIYIDGVRSGVVLGLTRAVIAFKGGHSKVDDMRL